MININLIAERRSRKIREMATIRMSALALIIVAAFAVLLNATAFYQHLTAEKDLNRTARALADLQPKYSNLLLIRQQMAARAPAVKLLKQVQLSEGAWMTIMADLSRVSTPDTVLDGFSPIVDEKGVSLTLTGRARDEQALASYMLALNQDTAGWAGNPVLHSLSMTDSSGVSSVQFNISIPVRGLLGGEL